MNLRGRDLLWVILGGALGAVAGFGASFFLKPGRFPQSEEAIGLRGVGMLFGAVGGLAISVMGMLFRRVHDPNAEPSRNFTSINGIGSMLFGKSEVGADGSYIATEWFIVFFVPIFPVCRYRVKSRGRGLYEIHAKYPPQLAEVWPIYSIEIVVVAAIVIGVLLFNRRL
jgi:hypothetical protein